MNYRLSPEVAAAQDAGTPVVALESTIITHGMPYPQNLDTARLVEEEIRTAGAVPATIAVLAGTLHIGLTAEQLGTLAQATDVMSCRAPIWPWRWPPDAPARPPWRRR